VSEKAHLDAVLAAMTAVDAKPYTLAQLNDLKTSTGLPAYYNEVTVSQRLGTGPRRHGAPSESTQWRILTRAVGQKYANAQEMRRRAAVALHEAKLTVGSETYFVERALSDDPIVPDEGWYSGTSEFAY
jgi:ribosomal protein L7/L12